ncbi:kinase-like domain-containing protein [Diaporthe sp. PMI_573]|nr:kinase-like domain-containing protein [Diaporthaceae sp. PMI_573]KAH8761650.1 kinase-like domain-containing protein [Diaporthaceae sp. PMI_573]
MPELNHTVQGAQDQVREAKGIQFATLRPGNAAALHLLEAVHDSDASTPCLVNEDERIAYLLSVPSLPIDSDDPPVLLGKWRVGAGPSPSLPKTQASYSKVDVLLCPPGNSHGSKHARKSIKSIHAMLLFHPNSGSLLLRNVCSLPIIYKSGDVNGNDLTLRGGGRPDSTCVLLKQTNHLHFGEYDFILEFTLQPHDYNTFTAVRNRLCQINPATCLAPVPNEKHFTLWDVRVHGELSKRPHESVHYGLHLHSGQPVAVKRIVYKAGREAGRRARTELQVASTSGTSDGLLGMITSWCEHGDSPPCWIERDGLAAGPQQGDEEVFYSMPLAESDFETLISAQWRKLGDDARLAYFHQTLSGLAMIHRRGFIHGRIRPKALMVISDPGHCPPTRAVITSAICTRNYGVPGHSGYWVAPEVWTSSKETCYSSKADVWALAASWLRAFLVPPAGLVRVNEGFHRGIVRSLEERCRLRSISEPLRDLLVSMLAWDPNDRPSVEEALQHAAWEPVRRWDQEKDDRRSREREEVIRGPPNGAKKVRLLSPEKD